MFNFKSLSPGTFWYTGKNGDIKTLIQRWAREKGFISPNRDFFDRLNSDFNENLGNTFPNYEFIDEQAMETMLNNLVNSYQLPVVSLDAVYVDQRKIDESVHSFSFSRMVKPDLSNVGRNNTFSRPGDPTLLTQVRSFPKGEVVLADDVLFTGHAIERTINILEANGTKVKAICLGVAIQGGIDYVKEHFPNIEIQYVKKYDEVVDQVCQRDFFPGVAYSGRSVRNGNDKNIGASYILPFGNAEQWASIPKDKVKQFSIHSIVQAIELYKEIEFQSKRRILCKDIDRATEAHLPSDKPFIDVLYEALGKI